MKEPALITAEKSASILVIFLHMLLKTDGQKCTRTGLLQPQKMAEEEVAGICLST